RASAAPRSRPAAAVPAAPGAAAAAAPRRRARAGRAAAAGSSALPGHRCEQPAQRRVERGVEPVFDMAHAGRGQSRREFAPRPGEAGEEIVACGGTVADPFGAAFGIAEAMATAEREVALVGGEQLDVQHFAPG